MSITKTKSQWPGLEITSILQWRSETIFTSQVVKQYFTSFLIGNHRFLKQQTLVFLSVLYDKDYFVNIFFRFPSHEIYKYRTFLWTHFASPLWFYCIFVMTWSMSMYMYVIRKCFRHWLDGHWVNRFKLWNSLNKLFISKHLPKLQHKQSFGIHGGNTWDCTVSKWFSYWVHNCFIKLWSGQKLKCQVKMIITYSQNESLNEYKYDSKWCVLTLHHSCQKCSGPAAIEAWAIWKKLFSKCLQRYKKVHIFHFEKKSI